MNVLFKYNIDFSDTENGSPYLYEKKRRDSCFALAYEENGIVTAMRDHLGVVALYYRYINNEIKFANNLSDLVVKSDKLSKNGFKNFLAFKSPKIVSLFENIYIVPPGSVIKINLKTKEVRQEYQYKFSQVASSSYGLDTIIDKLDKLFLDAVKRTVKYDRVGLYLSGGMDSALTGIYLKKLGVKINAYTLLPWGWGGSEARYAKINSKVINTDSHELIPMDLEYQNLIPEMNALYKSPQGDLSAFGVTYLWKRSSINNEQQIYGAQNADTVTCSMQAQYYAYFLSFLPVWLKKKINKFFSYQGVVNDYLSFVSKGIIHRNESQNVNFDSKNNNIQLLSLAGMYFGHTPCDGDVLALPVINNKKIYSNPFYDIDLIEFCLGIPVRYRLGVRPKESKLFFSLEKKVFRKLAERYLPKELVYRKKGLTLPMSKRRDLLENLPETLFNNWYSSLN